MKIKRLLIIFCSLVLGNYPILVNAASASYYPTTPEHDVYTINAEVCKIANCLTVGIASDWHNYSSTSATQSSPADTGEGQTLLVNAGDTLTFKGTVSFTDEEVYRRDPVYQVAGTNMNYLEDFDYFAVGTMDDLDNDGKGYAIDSGSGDISLNGGLSGADESQIGAVTSKVKADTPNGTIITVSFYLVNPNVTIGPNNIALGTYAIDDYLQSTVRLQVNNPQTQPVTTLPITGAKGSGNNINSEILLLILIPVMGFFALSRKQKN